MSTCAYIEPVSLPYKVPAVIFGRDKDEEMTVGLVLFCLIGFFAFATGFISSIVCLCLRIGPVTGDERPIHEHVLWAVLMVIPIIFAFWIGAYEEKYVIRGMPTLRKKYEAALGDYRKIQALGVDSDIYRVAYDLMLEINTIIRACKKVDLGEQLTERVDVMRELLDQRRVEYSLSRVIHVESNAALESARTLLENRKIAEELSGIRQIP